MQTIYKQWDLAIKLFHWILVLAFVASILSSDLFMQQLPMHMDIGMFMLSLLVFRVAWGFTGTSTARFTTFFPTIKRFVEYYKHSKSIRSHSPLGALSVFMLLFLLIFQSLSGLFIFNDEADIQAPLYAFVGDSMINILMFVHMNLYIVLIAMIALHISVTVWLSLVKRQPLISSMLFRMSKSKTRLGHGLKLDRLWISFSVILSVIVYAVLQLIHSRGG